MPKPSIADLLQASGFKTFTAKEITRAISALDGNTGANADERDWDAIMASSNPLEAAEQALKVMYQDAGYLLRNAEQLVQNGYAYSQAELTYRQIYGRLGTSYSPAWSTGTVMEEYGKLSDSALAAEARSDALERLPVPVLTISNGTDGFTFGLSAAATLTASDGKSLGRFGAEATALSEQASLVSGALTPTSDAGRGGGKSSQYFSIGTANADIVDTSGVNGQIDYIQTGGGADSVASGAGDDVIYLGTGADTVTAGAGSDVIYLGINDAAGDTVVYTAPGETAAGIFVSGGSTLGMDILNNVAIGDVVDLWDVFSSTPTISTSLLASATANNVSLVRGSYNALAQTFITGSGATDDDYVLQWADGTSVHNVIIHDYGIYSPDMSVNAANDTITFFDITRPFMVSARYGGKRITITYNEPIVGPAEPQDFIIRGIGFYGEPIGAIIGTGNDSNKLFLEFEEEISPYSSIYMIRYISFAGSIESIGDLVGNKQTNQFLTSGIVYEDTSAPEIINVEYEGNSVFIYYNENIGGSAEAGDYTIVLANTNQVAATSASISGKVVTLTVALALPANSVVSVAYAASAGTANSIIDNATVPNAAVSQTLANNIASLQSNLAGLTVSGTSGIDRFSLAPGDTGVIINDFTTGSDDIKVKELNTPYVDGFYYGLSTPSTFTPSVIDKAMFFISGGGVGTADTAESAASYISTLGNWTVASGLKLSFVVVDDNSTGIFSYVSDGLFEIEASELTLMASISAITVQSDYLFG